jgi:chromosome segregation ATPase
MERVSQQIKSVADKAAKLIESYEECRSANADLRKELAELETVIKSKDEEIEALQNKIKILKLAQNISGEETGEKTEIKRKINEYIREIDRCIAMLND